MSLQPAYRPDAWKQLNELNTGPSDRLWEAVVQVLDMICADSEDGTGRAQRVQGDSGKTLWAVRLPHRDPDDYYVLWSEEPGADGQPEAVIYYVGRLPHGLVRG